ncbi:MAG: hypothetical protein FWC65_01355 [Treponema sp.]|nr:hypothetical protein [Treponema sp.]
MKKIGFVLLAAALAYLGTSCVSPGRAELLSDTSPIALVSITSNWDINWKGEEAVNPNFIGAGTRRTLRADPDLTVVSNAEELIIAAERIFRETVGWSGLIYIAEQETVFNSRAYQEAPINRRRTAQDIVMPSGYRLIDPRDRNFPQALAAETGILRSMFVDFTFTKIMRSGFSRTGNCGADLDMRVFIQDTGGRTIFNRTFSVVSRNTISVSGGIYSRSGLMALFEEAIADAAYEFLYHLEGL